MKKNKVFLFARRFLISCITIIFFSNFFACSNKNEEPEILYIKTKQNTFYSQYIYKAVQQKLYYIKDETTYPISSELKPCEDIVKNATKSVVSSYTYTINNPFSYIPAKTRDNFKIILKNPFDEYAEDLEYYESDLYKNYAYWELQLLEKRSLNPKIKSKQLSSFNEHSTLYYTYSESLCAKLYMSITLELSEKKLLSFSKKGDMCQISYYTYEYDENAKLVFEKNLISFPIDQLQGIYYA